ncbi:uncharacterized protein LOC120359819 [Solenopsis invicta]|uniref:uncharacterized protein LOC120359819 n=1 Tax=Solenopsis invicta TaxID=13686 RepID=UPI00193CE730|nr:uncharacterized protein LOC120359819 [Solenopsis invicta]
MAVRFVVTVAIFQLAISSCYAVTGVIWHKQQQKFVQLFSIPQFAAFRKENLATKYSLEKRNLTGEVVKVVYYEEANMVMYTDNDTKINGFYGELWSLLADYLNFTLVPIKKNFRIFGQRLENGTQTGLLGVLGRNEAHVLLRSGYTVSLMDILQYTTPLWKISFHIYVVPEWQFDNTWMLKLFSWQSWFYTMFLFIILSCVGYFLQKVPTDKPKRKRKGSIDYTISDHVFYTFAIMTARGDPPEAFYNKFRILSLSKSIFAWLILLAFSSHLIYRMTNRQLMLPFNDVESLIKNTHYTLLAFRGSFLYNYFRVNIRLLAHVSIFY